jgi:hypothetical protein
MYLILVLEESPLPLDRLNLLVTELYRQSDSWQAIVIITGDIVCKDLAVTMRGYVTAAQPA